MGKGNARLLIREDIQQFLFVLILLVALFLFDICWRERLGWLRINFCAKNSLECCFFYFARLDDFFVSYKSYEYYFGQLLKDQLKRHIYEFPNKLLGMPSLKNCDLNKTHVRNDEFSQLFPNHPLNQQKQWTWSDIKQAVDLDVSFLPLCRLTIKHENILFTHILFKSPILDSSINFDVSFRDPCLSLRLPLLASINETSSESSIQQCRAWRFAQKGGFLVKELTS